MESRSAQKSVLLPIFYTMEKSFFASSGCTPLKAWILTGGWAKGIPLKMAMLFPLKDLAHFPLNFPAEAKAKGSSPWALKGSKTIKKKKKTLQGNKVMFFKELSCWFLRFSLKRDSHSYLWGQKDSASVSFSERLIYLTDIKVLFKDKCIKFAEANFICFDVFIILLQSI